MTTATSAAASSSGLARATGVRAARKCGQLECHAGQQRSGKYGCAKGGLRLPEAEHCAQELCGCARVCGCCLTVRRAVAYRQHVRAAEQRSHQQ
jgi:hypothetical protein